MDHKNYALTNRNGIKKKA